MGLFTLGNALLKFKNLIIDAVKDSAVGHGISTFAKTVLK
jgi:hypothetical protein